MLHLLCVGGSSAFRSFRVTCVVFVFSGGIRRFYRGVGPALIQGPMSRFGDTAANSGMMALLNSYDNTKDLPVFAKTMCASAAAASWRICLMPVDTLKTMLQVEGAQGLTFLRQKVRAKGPTVFYHGSLAAASATHVSFFFRAALCVSNV